MKEMFEQSSGSFSTHYVGIEQSESTIENLSLVIFLVSSITL